MLELPNIQMRAAVDAMTAVGPPAGLLNGVKVKLFKNQATPGPGSVLTDFQECDFDGYAESTAVVWGPALTNSLNQAFTVGGNKQFTCTGSTKPNTVYGYFLVDGAAGTTLIGAAAFDTPAGITGPGMGLVVEPTYVHAG